MPDLEPIVNTEPALMMDGINDSGSVVPDGGQPTIDPVENAPDPSIEQAKTSRLEQTLAKQNQMLGALGIDPESDIADRFKAGLVSREDLLRHMGVYAQPAVPPTQNAQPTVAPAQRLKDLREKAARGEATQEDFAQSLEIIADMASGYEQTNEQEKATTLYNQCRSATLSVLERDETFKALPDELKAIEAQYFLGSTDHLLATETKSDPKYFTPQAYAYFAGKNAEKLSKIRSHYIEQGRRMQQQALTGQPARQIQPMSTNAGAAPMTPPQPTVNKSNWKDAARAYVLQQGQV